MADETDKMLDKMLADQYGAGRPLLERLLRWEGYLGFDRGGVASTPSEDELDWAMRNAPTAPAGVGGHRNQGIVPFSPAEMTARLRDVEWINRYLADPSRPLSSAQSNMVGRNGDYPGFKDGGNAKYPGEGRESTNVEDRRLDPPMPGRMTDEEWRAMLRQEDEMIRRKGLRVPVLTVGQKEMMRLMYGTNDPAHDASAHYLNSIMSDELGQPMVEVPADRTVEPASKPAGTMDYLRRLYGR